MIPNKNSSLRGYGHWPSSTEQPRVQERETGLRHWRIRFFVFWFFSLSLEEITFEVGNSLCSEFMLLEQLRLPTQFPQCPDTWAAVITWITDTRTHGAKRISLPQSHSIAITPSLILAIISCLTQQAERPRTELTKLMPRLYRASRHQSSLWVSYS